MNTTSQTVSPLLAVFDLAGANPGTLQSYAGACLDYQLSQASGFRSIWIYGELQEAELAPSRTKLASTHAELVRLSNISTAAGKVADILSDYEGRNPGASVEVFTFTPSILRMVQHWSQKLLTTRAEKMVDLRAAQRVSTAKPNWETQFPVDAVWSSLESLLRQIAKQSSKREFRMTEVVQLVRTVLPALWDCDTDGLPKRVIELGRLRGCITVEFDPINPIFRWLDSRDNLTVAEALLPVKDRDLATTPSREPSLSVPTKPNRMRWQTELHKLKIGMSASGREAAFSGLSQLFDERYRLLRGPARLSTLVNRLSAAMNADANCSERLRPAILTIARNFVKLLNCSGSALDDAGKRMEWPVDGGIANDGAAARASVSGIAQDFKDRTLAFSAATILSRFRIAVDADVSQEMAGLLLNSTAAAAVDNAERFIQLAGEFGFVYVGDDGRYSGASAE